MLKEYLRETKNVEMYEEEHGFILFRIATPRIYIRDIYVKPEHRRSDIAKNMADKLLAAAKEIGCTHMYADVEPTNGGSTNAAKVLLAYGMEIAEANQDEIIFVKRI